MPTYEIDSQLKIAEAGVKIHQGQSADNERIKLWFYVHEGEYWGKPWWGNNLRQFQFLSPSQTVLSVLEMEVVEQIEAQLGINVLNITCKKPTSSDRHFWINIIYQVNKTGEVGVYQGDF